MAKFTKNVTEDGDTLLRTVPRTNDDSFFATLFCTGAFDGATVTIKLSPDDGTTKVIAKDGGGSDVAYTAADVKNFALGYGSNSSRDDGIKVYATVTDAGVSTDIDITLFDNQQVCIMTFKNPFTAPFQRQTFDEVFSGEGGDTPEGGDFNADDFNNSDFDT